ncbi:MAG: exodeoxyribonuclease VII small subunit [Peptostreptococcaceae bacterium]|nr:exodeoxyribonuclease VII small subunit [Peptostreptococcaceae bacterium]
MEFEKKLKEMDRIIEMLQDPDIDLKKAIDLYKKGIILNDECNKELESIKLSISTVDGEDLDVGQ